MAKKTVIVVAGVMEKGGKYLLARRKKLEDSQETWEFPGGKVQPKEAETAALKREFKEELGLQIEPGEFLGQVGFSLPDGTPAQLKAYKVDFIRGNMTLFVHEEARFLFPYEMDDYPMNAPDIPIKDQLKKRTYLHEINKALSLREEGKEEEAIQILHQMAKSLPDYPDVRYHLAWGLQSLGREEEALEQYKKALELGLEGEKRKETLLGLALKALTAENYPEAGPWLDQTRQDCGEDYDLLLFEGLLHLKEGKSKQGMEEIMRVVLETTNSKSVLKYESVIRYLLNRW